MDGSLLHVLNDVAWRHDWLGDAVEAYAKGSAPLFAALVVGLLVAGIRHRAALRAGLLAGASAAGALAVAALVARLVDRPRPFAADPDGVHLLARHAADPGFPSDHATAAFAIATALVLVDRRLGVPALVAAVALALDRVALGVHYPSDVLAGAALGIAVATLLFRLTRGLALGRVLDRVVAGPPALPAPLGRQKRRQ